jgi:hypothetical protein
MRGTLVTLAVLVTACASWGASRLTEVSKVDIDDHPFRFLVTSEVTSGDSVWFQVLVQPREDQSRWCVSGTLEVVADTLRVGSFSLEPKSGGSDWKWSYAFVLSQDYIDGSRFTFRDMECDMPAFDGYWFSLEKHCEVCARSN